MTLLLGLAAICMTVLVGMTAIIWMTAVRLRDRRDASEVVPLEVAVCIRKENGDVIIRQQRGKSILGLALGLLMVLGSLAMLAAQVSNPASPGLRIFCGALGLLILGALVAWVSGRGFGEPNVVIKAANQTVEIRHGLLRVQQTWPFDAIAGVTRRSLMGEEILTNVAEMASLSPHSSSSTDRVSIGLQHSDGRVVHICTAIRKAARRVPHILATAMGKPLLTE
jgi:hypothetical protein